LDRLGCVFEISSRSVQGFGFQLALHIPTDKQTSVRPFLYIYIDFNVEEPMENIILSEVTDIDF